MNFSHIHREHHVKVEIGDGIALVTWMVARRVETR